MVITAYDGRNVGLTLEAVELKCLMAVLQRADAVNLFEASKFISSEGFLFTPEDIKTHINHSILITRNLLSQVSNKPEEEPMPTPSTDVTPPSSLLM